MTRLRKSQVGTRKLRLARRPDAPHIAREFVFTPSEDQWQRIQSAYGVPFSHEDRAELTDLILDYLRQSVIAESAPTIKEVDGWLENARDDVQRAISSLSPRSNEDAFYSAVADLNKYTEEVLSLKFRDVQKLLCGLLQAIDLTRSDVNQTDGFDETDPWKIMAGKLFDFARMRDLSTAVSKGQSAQAVERYSPLTEFVWQLLNAVPARYGHRRYLSSRGALAQALAGVKKDRK